MAIMYSRKEFLRKLIHLGWRVTQVVFRDEATAVQSAGAPSADEEGLFKEAMAMGIDPGSIPTAELEPHSCIKKMAKRLKNQVSIELTT